MRWLGGVTFAALERALDAAALRHQVVANNVANANTPGFKRGRVDFEASLQEALRRVDEAGRPPGGELLVAAVRPTVERETGTAQRNDGNNVDIESEMALLAQNALWYQALARQLSLRIGLLRLAASEGRR